MERFKVSGAELRNFYNGNVELSRVFSDIENDLRSSNQVVCRYVINGLEISEADEIKFAAVSLADVETLEYLTENTRDLLAEVLRGWIDALPELSRRTENLSKRMRAQGFSGLLKSIHDLVQNCEFLIDSLLAMKSMMGDQLLVASPVDWIKAENESKRTVLEALHALENKDFVLLADILEYDLSNVLQMWFEHLQILEKLLNGEYTGPTGQFKPTGSNFVGRRRLAN